ncbi:hypothetical protein IFM89_020674 [Coptis chinensis]|uniref:ATP-dependent RNA helicase n=1 Tax=Coptis chinensis TaxID=261450 RepID=A0A835GYH4_9MAGN|nr:hypothetical protein IFM89_020674 [Coptis chinensis]
MTKHLKNMKPRKKNKTFPRKKKYQTEKEEISLLSNWIEYGKPDSGSNPLSIKPLSSDAPIGDLLLHNGTFSLYAGCKEFRQYPISHKTKKGLNEAGFKIMTDIQIASLPHTLCGRDILGAAKTGSGKTLAFIVPILEKLYREGWEPNFGVGCIIISPTRELAGQIFEVLNLVGKHHGFSAGFLIGGGEDVKYEKAHVNNLNILVCTPGRLVEHMNETPDFDCSGLQVLVLDEADRLLDKGFKEEVNAIISQLPKNGKPCFFQQPSRATPSGLQQTAVIVPLEKKLDTLWSFIKAHLNSTILVFLSTCKQVRFVFEAFKKLQPGIPLKCLHGRMKQEKRMGVYTQFCEQPQSVLFSTDVASRGLDFKKKAVDWVVQVDCPDDVASYIHRVGRTARYHSSGRSVLFLMPSEEEMLKKLQSLKVPVQSIKMNSKRQQSISGLLGGLLVKHPDLKSLAMRAYITYLRSIHKQRDKEVFDVQKLPIDEFSESLGLPIPPKVRFLNQKTRARTVPEDSQPESDVKITVAKPRRETDISPSPSEEGRGDLKTGLLLAKEPQMDLESNGAEIEASTIPATRILKKKKLKINLHRPLGKRCVFDEEGNTLPPLAALADTDSGNGSLQLDEVKRRERYTLLSEELKKDDKEDKLVQQQRLREKRTKEKIKLKRGREEDNSEEEESEDFSGSDREDARGRTTKRSKIYFSDNDDGDMEEKNKLNYATDSISLADQEALALRLLSSMHS